MPEEKKESFTFSDKIKNSKPAGNKSFAKSSSKIGRDGKPKQTLFERTRRDAPFFIAALVALLLLPFLYKFSGQASEESLLTPTSEESTFNPERYGFDTAMIEDPDGQIAQLSGRDSLDLIRGWGNDQEEDYGRDDMDFDASAAASYEGEGEYNANRSASTNIDEEENITNIYKRRARAGTRAAFRRTQIGSLNPASMRRGSGSRLGINNWGGSMKEAAKKVRPSGPTQGPKPVSLQPLRAGGPARSSFGSGAAQAARKGLDNMGKSNAREALRDSYVKPVGPSRMGGIDLFSDGRSGGGGKLDHHINIGKGETPWWWDMMKTRMQREWEERFNRKWNWIKFADGLAQNILKGLVNCIVTGDSDGDPDNFLGDVSIGGSSGKDPTCCGKKESWFPAKEVEDAGGFEKFCNGSTKKKYAAPPYNLDCGRGYKGGGSAGGASVGFFGQRLKCLGINTAGAYASGEIGLSHASGLSCADMPTRYSVVPSGEARKWNIYTYVVARNYFPEKLKDALGLQALKTKNGPQNLLCAPGQSSLNHAKVTGGVGNVKAKKDEARDSIIAQTRATSKVSEEQQKIREATLEIDQESMGDACVIVVSQGGVLPYETMKNKIMDLFKELGANEQQAREAFFQLDLMFVNSFAAKNKLAYSQWFESGHHLKGLLPLPYWEFRDAYIEHKKVTHKMDGSRDNIYKYKKKWRIEGQDMVQGEICYFDNLNIECGPEDAAQATVKFSSTSFHGGSGEVPVPGKDFTVSAEFRYLNHGAEKAKQSVTQPMLKPEKVNNFAYRYEMSRIYDSIDITDPSQALSPFQTVGADGKVTSTGLVGNIVWEVTRGDQVVTKECPLNLSGDGYAVIVERKDCPNGAQTSEECCLKAAANDPGNEYKWEGGKCVITPKKATPPQPDDPTPPTSPSAKFTLFAPGIKCVPNGVTDRKPRPDGSMTDQDMCKLFGSPLVGKYNTKGQSCTDLWGFTMDSSKATAFVNRVKEAYNKAHPELPIKFDKTYPQDSEFIDALNVAQSVGIDDVPMAAVCELGRDFVRMSKDKHAGNKNIQDGATGTKDEQLVFRNELGAFLAYIHDTSILYPDAFVRFNGKSECDWRFQPYGMADGGCSKQLGPKIGKAYAHNNYNGTKTGSKYQKFVSSLTPIMKAAPLQALVSGKSDLPHNCGNCKAMNGNNYVKQYNSYEGFAGLLHEESSSTNGQGIACEAFLGNNKGATMKVADVLKYIEGLCTAGLDYKPYGEGATAFNPNQAPTTTGGVGGKDQITSQPIGAQ